MQWNRSETIALSGLNCAYCQGLGLCKGRGNATVPCECVLRAIFKACFNRFRSCVAKDKGASIVRLERIGYGHSTHMAFGRKTEEYIADFVLACQRHLTESEYKLFRYAYLLGADWKLAHRFLNMPRTNFMHACYRLEAKLGRAFRETEPYALFPLDEYFSPTMRGASVPATVPPVPRPARLRPPLAAA
jgi:hypothetical protein